MLNVSRCSQRIMHKVRVQHQKLNMPICSLEFSAYCFILAAKSYSLHPQAVYCSFTLGKKQLLLTFPVKGAWRATWPTQHSCLREGQLCSSPRPPGMWWEHQHQAHTETTKFSCLQSSIPSLTYIKCSTFCLLSCQDYPGLNVFILCALPNLFRMGLYIDLLQGLSFFLTSFLKLFAPQVSSKCSSASVFTSILCCNICEH